MTRTNRSHLNRIKSVWKERRQTQNTEDDNNCEGRYSCVFKQSAPTLVAVSHSVGQFDK